MRGFVRSRLSLTLVAVIILAAIAIPLAVSGVGVRAAPVATSKFAPIGELDCNGYSKIQTPLKPDPQCTDFKGYDGGRGYDNGHYVGHDEPSVQFVSSASGSGNNTKWEITLPKEHSLPATQSFENYIAFWFSMALCDPRSYPQNPCIPVSDKNTGMNSPTDAGSAFLEMQFYPPGFSPFINKISCDTKHWCASLHINSVECNFNFVFCNPNCTEPTNFAFIQMDGIPTGPPGPASANKSTFTPNNQTLLMNPGDQLDVTINDTRNGVMNSIADVTTGKSGFMVASAKNGFQSLDLNTCNPTNFSFRPEYSTAKFGNFVPWAALQANVGFAMEIGHFTPGLNGDNDKDDAPCFKGPTLPGCLNFAQGGDIDFDGSSYVADWPDGTNNTPTSVRISSESQNGFGPLSAPHGSDNYATGYSSFQFETDVGASESTCMPDGSGCILPPPGATFYPFFARSGQGASCNFTFGNDIRGSTINDFGRDLQYGAPNLPWFFGTDSGGIRPNPCTPHGNN
jgi:hypothetical protein